MVRRRRVKATDIDWQELPEGPAILAVYHDTNHDLDLARSLGELGVGLVDELRRRGRDDVIVVMLPRDGGLEALSVTDMAAYGWVRRQDRQPGA
jgi:hypothetical protein